MLTCRTAKQDTERFKRRTAAFGNIAGKLAPDCKSSARALFECKNNPPSRIALSWGVSRCNNVMVGEVCAANVFLAVAKWLPQVEPGLTLLIALRCRQCRQVTVQPVQLCTASASAQ